MLDLLIRGAQIRTLDPSRPQAMAIGLRNGTIVGRDDELLGLPVRTTVHADGAVQ